MHASTPAPHTLITPLVPTASAPVTQSDPSNRMDLDETPAPPSLGTTTADTGSVQDICKDIDNLLEPAAITEDTDGSREL